jgi:serine/threonine protein kinase
MTDNSGAGTPEWIIGRYKILGELGKGGYGQVYKARHIFFHNRFVAIKLLKSRLTSLEEKARFLYEAGLLDKITGPHILPVIDAGFFEDRPYIITDYIQKGSLRDLLREQPSWSMSVDRSLFILYLSQIGTALTTIHQLSFVHGDLKPENILLREQDHALLGDFGNATFLGTQDVEITPEIKGTFAYMSPEQFQGKICRQSDQYALGCVAYELFTGQRPFTASDFDTWKQKHKAETPRPLRELNHKIEANIEVAVLTALAKEPGQRHANVDTFIKMLQIATSSTEIVTPNSDPHHSPHMDTAPSIVTDAAILAVVQYSHSDINDLPAPIISTPQRQPRDHPPNLHELRLPDIFVQLLTPALKAKGLTTDEATVYHSWSNNSYKYTRLLRNKALICCLLHIDDQFLQDTIAFADLSVMLDAFGPDQFLILFLDIPRLPPIQLRNLFEGKMKGKVSYIAKSDLDHLQSLPPQVYSDQLFDALKLKETVIPDQQQTENAERQLPIKDWYVEVDYAPSQGKSQEAKLFVTVTNEPSTNSKPDFQLQSLGLDERITVAIDGLQPCFDPVGSNQEGRTISLDERSTTFDFRLYQLQPCGFANVTANVFLLDRQQDTVASVTKTIKLSPDTKPPLDTLDLIMTVWKEGGSLCFSLRFADELSDRYMGSTPIDGDPKAYLERVHKYLNGLASPSDDIDTAQLRKDLEDLGINLYKELFPVTLQKLYWDRIDDVVQTWQLLLDPDASQIPWELLVPVDYESNLPKEGYKFLCEQHQLSRWFLAKKGDGVPALPQLINISPIALVSYDPNQLDGIAKEKDQLESLSALRVNSVISNHKDLLDLLSSDTMHGCFGLHLSGDGKCDESVRGCSFQLENDDPFTETDLNRLENRAFKRTRPFVFLNFCESGKIGHSLTGVTGIRGWIKQFMELDASCIVATMWKANDESAPDFSYKLYEQLLKGAPIGEAVQLARNHIMNRGDATWLCYTLYGDPRAKIGSVENQSI